MTPLDVARGYLARGWYSIPVPFRSKAPTITGWQDLRLDETQLRALLNGGPLNIGVLLGQPSGGLVDIDLDCGEALTLADRFLPSTHVIFGRPSKPKSHRLYVASPLIATEKFQDIGDDAKPVMLVELRSTGGQTVFPGSTHECGEPITFAEDGELARGPGETLRRDVAHLAAASLLARHWPNAGARHHAALAAAGLLARGGVDELRCVLIVQGAAEAAGDDEAAKRRRDVVSTVARVIAGEPVTGGPSLAELLRGDGDKVVATLRRWLGLRGGDAEAPHLTDAGNAQRFAREHGGDVHFCYPRRAWFVWDGVHWRRDEGDQTADRAKATARKLWTEVASAASEDTRKALARWAAYTESEPGIRRMLELAKSEPGIPVTPDELDRDPWLLNCPNGTLELRTGYLRPHRREDLITQVTAAAYEPGARHPIFDAFLERVLPDEPVRAFVQRVAGYALTASTREEKLFIAHGPTAGGKSTFLTALRRTLGDYATAADAHTFMERRTDAGAPRDDVVKLIGRRLVVSSEVKNGVRLAASLVKTLFGGDPMAARALYERTVEFTPVFKLVVAANQRPKAPDDDDALWRRLYEIPFTVSIPETERDPEVKTTLCDPTQAGAAVLAWCVEGCAAWLADGLAMPEAVRKASQAYRDEMDPLSDFISERCVLEKLAEVATKDLKDAYLSWARDTGVREPLGARAFNSRLESRGCARGRKGMTWFGIRLRTDTDPDPDTAETEHSEHSACNSPYTRAQEGVSAVSAPNTPNAPEVACSGCRKVSVRARLTEFEGALWCPSCLYAKSSYRARGRA